MTTKYEAVVGLEIHVQLNAATKMFCDCPNRFGDEPNQNTCPICLWFPGASAQLSREVVEKAVGVAMTLNCTINQRSRFDQKVYYYPDLPKGFQLSQFHRPLAGNGWVEITGEDGALRRLRIRTLHLEEDVAKLVHETEGKTRVSLVDFNRAGCPLVEIVTEPDMRSPYEAMEFVNAIRTLVPGAGGAECSLERGTMRVDANISLRPAGSQELNVKVEVKNMNSVRGIGDAIAYEIKRQQELIQKGEAIILHTRLWDPKSGRTLPMREKFSGPCVPDPSVPEVVISDQWLAEIKNGLPEIPARKQLRFVEEYGLTETEAAGLTVSPESADYSEAVIRAGIPARLAAQWIAGRLLPAAARRGLTLAETKITPERLAGLLALVENGKINPNAGRQLLELLFEDGRTPAEIAREQGLDQAADSGELEKILARVLAENPRAVEDFRKGRSQSLGFLTGQAVRLSGGKADPRLIRQKLEEKLRSE
ncbi:MAG TPA: Asp-tRNA(Asn)/Glu-tRNA(Gln) amidotransferase subunit GatB [bacterium]|uniref:Aspartyl/glutamyl-tRNA(Asn/Gln) amidotransferase subunit B n=1 Tax=candidate division TA06 bacterium ADurb.Bin417 TaxID=1852828 RepID=A0A1V5MJU2_UNCT6|nr:MAG: Aspartyl/glutamyl-tRNA(Asn/Gln) amidotransferase subunit B [candidate division TA06 bacterium ADurb.Bin417]HNQ34591.1 Asp-tRNA(Asn)/Glu-tRNA(Gln) amidotransferase subunit GatB [bacterium]HNS48497.1 Asp-tRNA(Asn)/Glu-tRNA(Gln) amidotransferase subunit GatB [bacterium]